MKHLRDMRQTFPHIESRSAIMGLATANIPAHEIRKRQEEQLEQKKRRQNCTAVRVTFIVRPHLPPCFTAVINVSSSTRISDLTRQAYDVFSEESLRRGDFFGALPTANAACYCLRRFNSIDGSIGPECPSRAIVTKILAARSDESQADTPAERSYNVSSVDRNHLAWVLQTSYLDFERIVSTETKTRAALFNVFLESMDALRLYERAKRDSSRGMELQRQEFSDARESLLLAELSERQRTATAEHTAFLELRNAFERRYGELEVTMLALVTKLNALRHQHRLEMARAVLARSGA